jgi:hypothetical protein
MFSIKDVLKEGNALSLFFFIFVLEYAIRRFQKKQDGLKLCGTNQLLVYADGVYMLGGSVHTIKKNTGALLVASKNIRLEINNDKTKCMFMSRDQNSERSHNIKTDNNSSEGVEQFKYLGTTLTNQNSIQEEIKSRLRSGNTCYHSVQNILSFSFYPKICRLRYTEL